MPVLGCPYWEKPQYTRSGRAATGVQHASVDPHFLFRGSPAGVVGIAVAGRYSPLRRTLAILRALIITAAQYTLVTATSTGATC